METNIYISQSGWGAYMQDKNTYTTYHQSMQECEPKVQGVGFIEWILSWGVEILDPSLLPLWLLQTIQSKVPDLMKLNINNDADAVCKNHSEILCEQRSVGVFQ